MADNKYRLVTRSDFDGLVCAVLLKKLNLINDIKFVHPKDMQDGKIAITENDITTTFLKPFAIQNPDLITSSILMRLLRREWYGTTTVGWMSFLKHGWK